MNPAQPLLVHFKGRRLPCVTVRDFGHVQFGTTGWTKAMSTNRIRLEAFPPAEAGAGSAGPSSKSGFKANEETLLSKFVEQQEGVVKRLLQSRESFVLAVTAMLVCRLLVLCIERVCHALHS